MINTEVWVMIRKTMNDGVSITEAARQLGCSRPTVYKYAKQDSKPLYKRKGLASKLEPFKQYLQGRLDRAPFSAVRLFEEIKQQGYAGKLTILKEFVREVKKQHSLRAVMRFETMPGQQAQVDWGDFGTIIEDDVKKKLFCFFIVLGYSRTKFVKFTTSTIQQVFLQCHMEAFKYFGGVPKEILYDNLKQVVIKRLFKVKDSEMNKRFMDFAGHYGFNTILCRPYRPQTKGKVENPVKYVRQNFFLGIEFTDLADLNRQASAWLEQANNRVHGTTKEKPFERLVKENLTMVQGKPEYDNSEVFYRKASMDCWTSFEGSKYSVPSKYAGKEISIKKAINRPLEFFYRAELICEHVASKEKGASIAEPKHFEGLKELSYKTKKTYRNKHYTRQLSAKEVIVETRPLSIYDSLVGGDVNGQLGI